MNGSVAAPAFGLGLLYLVGTVLAHASDPPRENVTIGGLATCMDRAVVENQFPKVFDVYHDPDGVNVLLTVYAHGPEGTALLQKLGVRELFPDSRFWLGYLFFQGDRLSALRFRITTAKRDSENFTAIKQFVERSWPSAPLETRSDLTGQYLSATIADTRLKVENSSFDTNFDAYSGPCK